MSSQRIVSSAGPICFVGGAPVSASDISDISQYVTGFVGVDSGADTLRGAGVMPLAVIGDMDSISQSARDTFGEILCEIAEQSTTDFEKALTRVAAPVIIGLGFTGGRMDHILSVLNVMLRCQSTPVVLADPDDVSFLAQVGRTVLTLPDRARVSVMALGDATVTLDGVVWPFADTLMRPDGFTSPSNAALGGDVVIDTDAPVLITLPRSHLAAALKAAVRAQ